MAKQHHLLYQLPTGGGKTVIFSEMFVVIYQNTI
jgi:superfamily II DNA or RNA helicase